MPGAAERFLDALCAGTPPIERRVAVVVAHPDDETIGCGAQLARFRDLLLVHVTDGAPRSRADAADYATMRAAELAAVLDLAGIPRERTVALGVVDQEAALAMAAIARRLAEIFADFRPEIVLTHAYEGGHPDHDATCFAVHAAVELIHSVPAIPLDSSPACGGGQGGGSPPHARQATERRRVEPPAPPPQAGEELKESTPVVIDFPLYRAAPNPSGWALIEFLPGTPPGRTVELDEGRRAMKARLLACHRSQREMLQHFPLGHERFRAAPRYDFAAPPHPGELFYERLGWGIDGGRWRMLAASAASELAR